MFILVFHNLDNRANAGKNVDRSKEFNFATARVIFGMRMELGWVPESAKTDLQKKMAPLIEAAKKAGLSLDYKTHSGWSSPTFGTTPASMKIHLKSLKNTDAAPIQGAKILHLVSQGSSTQPS